MQTRTLAVQHKNLLKNHVNLYSIKGVHRNDKKQITINIPVFLHRVNVRKHVYIIPHLRERKIVKQH